MATLFSWQMLLQEASKVPFFRHSLPMVSGDNTQQQLLASWYAKNLNIPFSSISNTFQKCIEAEKYNQAIFSG